MEKKSDFPDATDTLEACQVQGQGLWKGNQFWLIAKLLTATQIVIGPKPLPERNQFYQLWCIVKSMVIQKNVYHLKHLMLPCSSTSHTMGNNFEIFRSLLGLLQTWACNQFTFSPSNPFRWFEMGVLRKQSLGLVGHEHSNNHAEHTLTANILIAQDHC